MIDANSNRSTTIFDATGRAVASQNGLGYRVTQIFDAAGRRTALVDARSNRYTFVWDAANRQIRQVDSLSRTVTLGYNAASEQTLRIDARGFRTTYVADNLSRPIKRLYPDGSRVTMSYDAVSNRTLLADSAGRYTTLYDALNRARAVTNPAQLTISYSFDGAGRRSKMVEPFGGVFTYGYSATNVNTLLVNPQGERTTWQFDAASRVTVQRLANLVRVSYAYDNADRLVRLANVTSTGTTITSYVDKWDGADNRLWRVEQDGTRVTWSYDSTYQLTNERRSGANSYNTTYAYDPSGNRRSKLDNAVRTTYSYDAANQLQKYVDNTGATTFSFDASGNQRLQIAAAGGGTTTNTWDFENRLTKVALPTAVLNTFTYNGDGLRVQRQDSSGTSKQIWDNQKIVEETDQNNISLVVYTQSDRQYGDVVSQRRSGTSGYFHFDPLGSTARLTDGSQNITDSYLFKAFGESLIVGAGTTWFRYVGAQGYSYEPDFAGYYARARDYAPMLARWLSLDEVAFLANDANGYWYALNNALCNTDPAGRQAIGIGGLLVRAMNCICCYIATGDPRVAPHTIKVGQSPRTRHPCTINWFCSPFGCGDGAVGRTSLDPNQRDVINICVTCGRGLLVSQAIVAHELAHAYHLCTFRRGPRTPRVCSECIRWEEAGYEKSCAILKPPPGGPAYKRCVKCGIYASCGGRTAANGSPCVTEPFPNNPCQDADVGL